MSDNLGKANLLNSYFASVCNDYNSSLPPLYHCASFSSLSDITFTEENVTGAISKLKSNLSCGPDDLPSLLFKRLCPVLAQPLAILYQQLFFCLICSSRMETCNNNSRFFKMVSPH